MSEASRLKFCRNANWGANPSKKKTDGASSRLSLTAAGSSMNAALGDVLAGGVGTPLLDVTQSGGAPSALVASQPSGNAGGATLSKFSFRVSRPIHGNGPHLLPIASRGISAMLGAMSESSKNKFRNSVTVNARFRFASIVAVARSVYRMP